MSVEMRWNHLQSFITIECQMCICIPKNLSYRLGFRVYGLGDLRACIQYSVWWMGGTRLGKNIYHGWIWHAHQVSSLYDIQMYTHSIFLSLFYIHTHILLLCVSHTHPKALDFSFELKSFRFFSHLNYKVLWIKIL